VTIEIVDGLHHRFGIVAFPPQKLAHVRPALLLHVRVVILLVGPSTRQLNLLLLTPTLQMPVDELRSVVRVHPQKTEGQYFLDLIQPLLHRHLALPQQGARLRPAAMDVG